MVGGREGWGMGGPAAAQQVGYSKAELSRLVDGGMPLDPTNLVFGPT